MAVLGSIYARLPVAAQHAAVSAYGVWWRWARFGPGYRSELAGFLARERWSAEDWASWQQKRLAELVEGASARVPFYRNAYRSHLEAVRHARLEELPLLDKEPLRADPRAFLDPAFAPLRPLVFHTSGSTGTPVATYWTLRELRASMAVREARSARWAGVSFTMPRATFSGRLAVPDAESSGPYHRFNAAERQVYLSPFHLLPDTAEAYAAALRRHGVRWATGYAVSFHLLARNLIEQGVEVPQLDAVVTTSEKLDDEMRASIGQAFRCDVFEEYSTVENALFASECEEGSLHVSPDIGIVEILRPDGSPCEAGEVGEVVATPLFRSYQPLIRYRLGDLAAWEAEPCRCGRAMRVLGEVVGRLEDVVRGPDGRELVRFHGIFIDLPVREGQVVQETLDRFRVRVVAGEGFTKATEHRIVARMRERLGSRVTVTVDLVPMIERTAGGKFRAVVSHVR